MNIKKHKLKLKTIERIIIIINIFKNISLVDMI